MKKANLKEALGQLIQNEQVNELFCVKYTHIFNSDEILLELFTRISHQAINNRTLMASYIEKNNTDKSLMVKDEEFESFTPLVHVDFGNFGTNEPITREKVLKSELRFLNILVIGYETLSNYFKLEKELKPVAETVKKHCSEIEDYIEQGADFEGQNQLSVY
ncbi:MAG: hypothetical protein OEY59_10950 [Deltaproteobacteria bacterium]|nr:hypothetical protein [Deltaproteobacteria bacterium]